MARIDDIRKQNPQLDISLIDIIASADPTSTYKYLPFLIKVVKSKISSDVASFIAESLFSKERLETLNRFEEHATAKRITNTDITSYRDFDQVFTEVKKGDEIVRLKELEKQTVKIYDANGWMVLIPLTYEASKTYGTNTKWCVTQKTHWDTYQWKYKLVFIIDKNNNKKYAISKNYDDHKDIKAWLADDSETSPLALPLPAEVWGPLMGDLSKPKNQTEVDSLKPNTIITKDGMYKFIDDASATELSWFTGKFGTIISKELKEQCIVKITEASGNVRSPVTSKNGVVASDEFLKFLTKTFREKKLIEFSDNDNTLNYFEPPRRKWEEY